MVRSIPFFIQLTETFHLERSRTVVLLPAMLNMLVILLTLFCKNQDWGQSVTIALQPKRNN